MENIGLLALLVAVIIGVSIGFSAFITSKREEPNFFRKTSTTLIFVLLFVMIVGLYIGKYVI
jgi:uncharacterized membrane protein YczE